MCGVGVDVCGCESAGGGGESGDRVAVIEVAGFCDGSGEGGSGVCDHRDVIGAVDGDGDGLIDEGTFVIGDACGVGLGDGFSFLEGLSGGEGVVERVGPHPARRIEGDRAVGGGSCALDGPGLCGVGVDVCGAQGPRNAGGSSQQGSIVEVTRFNDGAHIARDATAPRAENQLRGVVTLRVITNALASPNSR